MCGIAGIAHLQGQTVGDLARKQAAMLHLIRHRGPDGEGLWRDARQQIGLVHARLSILDVSAAGHQPMVGANRTVVAFNGAIYNYRELRGQLANHWAFQSKTDTEVLLAAYAHYGTVMLPHLRGMFAFALWDETNQRLFCARDRFGIKPFYYTVQQGVFYFASEAKALLPFVPQIETDTDGLSEYFTFQHALGEHTMFKGIKRLLPGHALTIENGQLRIEKYWDVNYITDWEHSPQYFQNKLRDLLDDSVNVHLRADVPIGSYLSGGVDSSLIAILASEHDTQNNKAFHGKFTDYPGYDESAYARAAADKAGKELFDLNITHTDFSENIADILYHLDYPTAGPGSFPQYMVSALAAKHVKVVLGGQGGDEIFGGYARYLIAYFEQCFRAAIDGTYKSGNFIVTPESIIPNLGVLREYKPMLKNFFREGMFDSIDKRYFRLLDRFSDNVGEVKLELFDREKVETDFMAVFNANRRVKNESYFDSMTHFDFKTLLPALLHVEDRMSMAHAIESRVPMLDHALVEFAATIPSSVKFKDGQLKLLLRQSYSDTLPQEILQRRDKMGFSTPLSEWFTGPLRGWLMDTMSAKSAQSRDYLNHDVMMHNLEQQGKFSRKLWGLLSLEIWQQQFHDRQSYFQNLDNFAPSASTESAA